MDRPLLGPIDSVTVVTPAVSAAANVYCRTLGYEIRDVGRVDAALAHRWRAPRSVGARYAVVGPPSHIGAPVRFVEGPGHPAYVPGRAYGWGALEIAVPDVDRLAATLPGSGFTVVVPPAALVGTARPALRAMQCLGPAGELVYFTQILGPLPPFDLPRSSGQVDGVFIVVVAASALEVTRAWFEDRFAVDRASDREVAVQVVNHVFGLEPSTRHRISSIQLRGQNAIEHDQYPEAAAPRPCRPGHLPPGIASVALVVDRAAFPVAGAEDDGLVGPDGIRVELVRPAASSPPAG